MYGKCFIFVFLIFSVFQCTLSLTCDRPSELKEGEDLCWRQKVEVIERIQQTEKKVLNFARKKLGMEVNERPQPQKCEYYYCVFDNLKLINPELNVPSIERISDWIKQNVAYNYALILLERSQNCTEELTNSIKMGTYFLADNVDIPQEEHITINESEAGNQGKCDIAAEYMKCLADQRIECPVFQYS